MRLLGAFSGGVWGAKYLTDMGNGRFDGAWLVQNFQLLKPEAALWEKFYTVFANPDHEGERFLEFERWWNGFYFLSREELVATVQDLFVGNKLETGEVRVDCECTVILRRICKPVVIFASYGDNITPPHQALGWIPVVYASTEDLVAAGQRIVHLTNPHVGHLGIFVSASVARHENMRWCRELKANHHGHVCATIPARHRPPWRGPVSTMPTTKLLTRHVLVSFIGLLLRLVPAICRHLLGKALSAHRSLRLTDVRTW